HMEHHANIVPWHMLVAERGIVLRWIPLTSDFQLDLTNLDSILSGAKVLSFTSMSNVLGMLKGRFGDDITIHGPSNPEVRGATFSFAFRGIHPHDLSQVLDQHNVCVRAGHHCAKPLMRLIGANATARASFYLYNTTEEADALADALESASDIF
ncbi:MAG: aminotransferase class V-fold PLP-dependent enzyme, partial [Actinobacteria bacterium]|nr:aminotransferase class V-fold PLP-dependent enzyme [Actinomycetota bacterium]